MQNESGSKMTHTFCNVGWEKTDEVGSRSFAVEDSPYLLKGGPGRNKGVDTCARTFANEEFGR